MELRRLRLVHFRNYEQKEARFQSGLNCIEGVNGSGKSNLLEALYLISTGKSFRTHRLQDLIQHEKERFILEVDFIKGKVSHNLRISFGQDGRKFIHNATSYTSFLPLLGLLPFILLSPEDVSILTGPPGERRRFLDIHIAQTDPLYLYHLGRYQRAMKQRNALLKKQEEKGLFAWEQIMALSATYLTAKRQETLAYLHSSCEIKLKQLSSQKESFSVIYAPSLNFHVNYEKQWKDSREKDFAYGSTLAGPHRDEVVFLLEKKEVKTYCSEGQKRCCLAALRLSEWERTKDILRSAPLFGVDDFGIHLDEERASFLQEPLRSMGQVFLTAPSLSHIKEAHIHTLMRDAGNKLGLKENS